MKKFFKKKLFKSTSSKQSISSLNSLAGDVFSGYHVDLNTVDARFTKLHKASWGGEYDKLKAALKKVDVNAFDSENRTALHLATAGGHSETVQLLLRSRAGINLQDAEGKTPLIKAVECHHEDLVHILLNHGADANLVDHNGNTALHVALAANLPDITIALLHHSVDVSIQNKEGTSALHLAILHKHSEAVELLLDKGADPNVQDEEGRTPLMVACHIGCAALTSLLLNKGAVATQTDLAGWTALDHATKAGHKECQEVLSVFFEGLIAPAEDVGSWKSTESDATERLKKPVLPLVPQIMSDTSPRVLNKGTPKGSTSEEHCKPSLLGVANYDDIHSSEEHFLMEEKSVVAHRSCITGVRNANKQSNGEDDDSVEAVLKKTGTERNFSGILVSKSAVPNKGVATMQAVIMQVPNTQTVSREKQLNDLDDMSKWFTEDTSLTESEIEEKATSLYAPSCQERRPSVMDPDVHKSVEVLLAYDGQQLRGEAGTKQTPILNKESKAEGKMMATVRNTDETKKIHVPVSPSEWDSSESEEDLPEEHNAEQSANNETSCRVDNRAEEIGEQHLVDEASQETPGRHSGNETEKSASELVIYTDKITTGNNGASVKTWVNTVDDTPRRPPRALTKNRLRSSWSSATSCTSSQSQSLAQANLRRQSLIVGSNGEANGAQGRRHSGSLVKPRLPKKPNFSSSSSVSSGMVAAVPQEKKKQSKQRTCHDGQMSVTIAEGPPPDQGSEKAPLLCGPTAKPHSRQNGCIKETEHHTGIGRLSREQSVEKLLKEKKEVEKAAEECRQQGTIAKNLRAHIGNGVKLSIREADVEETLDRQLAELDLELKSAKSLIKDLHHEVESLQMQLNSYKQSADMYKEANDKQEGIFRSILTEKEAMWMEEKQKLLAELQKCDAQIAEANSSSELADIHGQLTSLHSLLASLNTKVSIEAEHPCLPVAEDISALVKISSSTLSDLQKLNVNVDHTSQLLDNISENLQNYSAQGKTIEMSLDNLHPLIGNSKTNLVSTMNGLQALASDGSSICETLERLEANQKVLADTLGELQALISKSSYSLTPEKAKSARQEESVLRGTEECPVRDDLPIIRDGIARILNKLESFADEIKNAAHSEAEGVAQKIAESFEEYHTITKQEMLNLMNKISCDQETIMKVSASLNEQQKCQDVRLSAELADFKLNQSRALEELQSLRDELIRMDASGMFEKIETIHADAVGKMCGIMEPVSTELKSLHAALDAQKNILTRKLDENITANGVEPSQLRGMMEKLDSVLDQTTRLRVEDKEELKQLENASPGIDFPMLLSDLKTALSGLKEEIRKRCKPGDQAEGHASLQAPTVPSGVPSADQFQLPVSSGIMPHFSLEKEKYRNKKALAKYRAELKGIKEKLKEVGQHQIRGNISENVQATLTAAELQKKIDILNLRIDIERQHQTEVEIQSLKTEIQQIQHQLPEPVEKQNLKHAFPPFQKWHPEIPPDTVQGHAHGVNDDTFKKCSMELMQEITDLQQNITTPQPSPDYWWLRENHFRGHHAADSSDTDSSARRKKAACVLSTPLSAAFVPVLRGLPSWNLSPVTSRVTVNGTSSARYRVQAMLDESFSKHLGNTNPDPVCDVRASSSEQYKKPLADLTGLPEKTYLV